MCIPASPRIEEVGIIYRYDMEGASPDEKDVKKYVI